MNVEVSHAWRIRWLAIGVVSDGVLIISGSPCGLAYCGSYFLKESSIGNASFHTIGSRILALEVWPSPRIAKFK